jgi:preprotein translocase subunit SecG
MATVLLVIHIMVAFSMIVLILLQRSEGGALGMGGGGGGFVTGRGAANLLTRTTAVLAGIFFLTSLVLGNLGHKPPAAPVVALPSSTESAPAQAPSGEQAPSGKPSLSQRLKQKQTSPGQSPEPAVPQLPQSQ